MTGWAKWKWTGHWVWSQHTITSHRGFGGSVSVKGLWEGMSSFRSSLSATQQQNSL